MYVNIAVLKETHQHERRVALVPSVVGKLTKLGAKLHMQSGAGNASKLVDAAFQDVSFAADRHALVRDADVVLAVQPPALDVINEMKEGAILISFIYAGKEPKLVKRLLEKKITCFAMERIPRITRAQAMDACPVNLRWRDITRCNSARLTWPACCRKSRLRRARSGLQRCW